MSEEIKHILLTGDCKIECAAADDPNPKIPTFQTLAYNGGTIRVPGIPLPISIDLTGVTVAASVSILKDHDNKMLLGQATDVVIDGNTIRAAGVITGDESSEPHVKDVLFHARRGFNWQTSVGVGIDKIERVEAGHNVTVNGKTVYGPAMILREGVLKEISVTSVGCDHETDMKIAASAVETNLGEIKMADEVTKTEAPAVPEAVQVVTPVVEAAADPIAEMREAAAAEATLIGEINTLCASYGDSKVASEAISKNWSKDATELALLRASRAAAPAVQTSEACADRRYLKLLVLPLAA